MRGGECNGCARCLRGTRTTDCKSPAFTCASATCALESPSFRPRRSNSSVCGMCGVAFASRSKDAESRVRAMTAAMRHRGPDEEGFLVGEPRAPGLALGMRRLSIIDLAGGHQPVWNETRDVAVIYNGELY